MATYAERVAALKKAGAETKKKHAEEKKAKRLKKAYKKEAGLKWYQKAPKDIKEKAAKKSKAKETGKVRRGAKGVESTKGGEYVKYGKKSKPAKSFREAFKAAKGKNFTWDGRSYSGKTADDAKKAKAAKPKGKGVTVSSVGKKYKKPIDKKGMQVTKSAITQSMRGKKKDKVLAAKKPSNPSLSKGLKSAAKTAAKALNPVGYGAGKVAKVIAGEVKERESTGAMEEGGKVGSYEGGGKVESNPYGWPTRDARNGGNK